MKNTPLLEAKRDNTKRETAEKRSQLRVPGPVSLYCGSFKRLWKAEGLAWGDRRTATVLVSFKLPSKDKFTQQAVK